MPPIGVGPTLPPAPGLVVVQVDGLSHRDLQKALSRGLMPHLKERLDAGELTADTYHCGLPSQTCVSQGGFLFGRSDLPSNQWFDKASGEWINSMGLKDGADVEDALNQGGRGLISGGSAYLSPLGGGAKHHAIVISNLSRVKRDGGEKKLLLEFAREWGHLSWSLAVHPVQAARTGTHFVRKVGQEMVRRRHADIPRPGIKRRRSARCSQSIAISTCSSTRRRSRPAALTTW